MVIKMKISWMKSKSDFKSFRFAQNMGFDVYEIEDLEKTDEKISELIQKQCHTIVLTNEIASFSEDIIKKYAKNDNINIIISKNKQE